MPLGTAQVLPLVGFLVQRVVGPDDKAAAGATAFLELLSDDHTHAVLAQTLSSLENIAAVASAVQQLNAVLSLAGKLLLRPRVAAATANRNHGARLLQLVRHVLETVHVDSCRSACFYILQRLLQANDAASVRFVVLPTSWELVCAAMTRGSDAEGGAHLRTNALALLCFILQNSDAAVVPWPKLTDALKVVLSGGETQHRLIACHILLEGVQRGIGAEMLSRDVALHLFEAARRHQVNDALAKKLVQLIILLASRAAEAFSSQVPNGAHCFCEVVDRFLQAGESDLVGMSLELLINLLRFSELSDNVSFRQFVASALRTSAPMVAQEVQLSFAVSWMQIAHHVLPTVMQENEDERSTEACCRIVSAVSAVAPVVVISPQHVALALSLSCMTHNFEAAGQVAQRHASCVRDNPFVCLEMIAVAVASATNGPLPASLAEMFPVVIAGAFSARRTLSSVDATVLSLCDGLVSFAKCIMPWWQPRMPRVPACMLRLPEPTSWLEMLQGGEYVFEDQHLMSLILGLSCAAAIVGESLLSGDVATAALQSLVISRPEMATSPAGMDMAMLLCLAGWRDSSSALAVSLAQGVLAAKVPLSPSMPHRFLAWTFSVHSLEPLATDLVHLLVEGNDLASIVSGSASAAVTGHLLKLLASSDRSARLRDTIEAFLQVGEEAVALFVIKGLATVLQTVCWCVQELPWLCRIITLLLRNKSVSLAIGADLVFGRACGDLLLQSPCEEALLAWYNAAAVVLSQIPGREERVALAPAWVLNVTLTAQNAPLMVAQLQVAGLCVSCWVPSLFRTSMTVIDDPLLAQEALTASASLFLLRSMLATCPSGEGPSGEDVHELWLLVQSIVVSSLNEPLRHSAGKTAHALFRFCGADEAKALVSLPWSWFTLRNTVEKLSIIVPGSHMSRGLLEFLCAMMPFLADWDAFGTDVMARFALECATVSDDLVLLNVVLEALSHIKLDSSGRDSMRRAIAAKIQALGSSSDRSCSSAICAPVPPQAFHEALVFTHFLWGEGDATPLRQAREDRLFRIDALLKS